ncbi:siderophore-interacting protein [Sphingorhabdus sp. 109]|jgi:NADPH-dependent ferric siderophore reductase|uniref:siderophore-interacting protein n=1 Tax=Sphingorhabdus sp. 109 TaxID=2653173 RepID=UPI0012EF73D4|nr:siderophore-interacting protein [Sphingorhabdus sp. 109]VWX55817.1 NADPH-dependent ferric siderophore reductase [Sphingorhabdus sp. 109]
MARPEPRILKVIDSMRLTPNMHRVILGGDGLAGFPAERSGGYVKLMLPDAGGGRPLMRTYSIRSQSETGIAIDFALHGPDGDSGPATSWALEAQAGDLIRLGGPGDAKPLPTGRGPFLLVGDMTALPAISVNLEGLPADATGDAILLVRDEEDKQTLAKPDGVTVHWLVDAELGAHPALLADAARQLPAVEELAYAWVACEFEAMKLLRQFLRVEQGFGPDRLYISSYWKRGLIEDDHKQVKRADAEAGG